MRRQVVMAFIGAPLAVAWFLFVHSKTHTGFTLVLVALVPVAVVANLALASRGSRRLTDPRARKDEYTGAWSQALPVPPHRTDVAPRGRWVGGADVPGGLGRMNATWPLGVLEVTGSQLTLRVVPGFLSRLFGAQSLDVHPADVEAVFPARGRLRSSAVGIRPRNQPPFYFLSGGGDRSAILTAAWTAGFPVDWYERVYSYA